MGRKTKLTAQITEKIVEVLRLTGSDCQAYEVAEISEATYYRWQKEFREFRELVAQSKQRYRESCPEQLREKAMSALLDYLYGRVEETWTSEETIIEGDKVVTKSSIKKVKRGVPSWVIERILGKPLDELEAVKCLVESGWLPYSILTKTSESLDTAQNHIRKVFESEKPQV